MENKITHDVAVKGVNKFLAGCGEAGPIEETDLTVFDVDCYAAGYLAALDDLRADLDDGMLGADLADDGWVEADKLEEFITRHRVLVCGDADDGAATTILTSVAPVPALDYQPEAANTAGAVTSALAVTDDDFEFYLGGRPARSGEQYLHPSAGRRCMNDRHGFKCTMALGHPWRHAAHVDPCTVTATWAWGTKP